MKYRVGECVSFLQSYAESMGLPSAVHYMAPKKPVVIITLTGQKSELPALLLTSHMDVVPVYPVCLNTQNITFLILIYLYYL